MPTRYEVTLPESGCKLIGITEHPADVDAFRHLGWKIHITREIPQTQKDDQ